MYNFVLRDFALALGTIEVFGIQRPFGGTYYTDEEARLMAKQLRPAVASLKRIEFHAAADQLEAIVSALTGRMPRPARQDVETRFHVLLQTIHSAAQHARFYYYPNAKADVLQSLDASWKSAFLSFPAAESEVRAGVDLWALGHSTASVFHMVRVAEIGLRAIAQDLNLRISAHKPIDYETFGTVLTAIRSEVDRIHQMYPNTRRKEEAVEFYSTAVGALTAIKDKYRDQVSHMRREYDEHEAMSAISHVREFMLSLSKRLNQSSTKSISWGLRRPTRSKKSTSSAKRQNQ